ncbi:MAG: sugar phosphate isomerase/epimerase [Clostridiales bacterium]|jgi:sugar phosphate isomerase/epimerase|nr:sugar phosphate isomerase/epimerase [Clostridiales bacterium]
MKTSVSTYSFSKLIKSGEFTQLSVIRLAKNMGFDGIEFTNLEPPKGVEPKEYALELREECAKNKIDVVNYTIGAELLNAESLDKEVERLYEQADIAALLGAKGMRHDATRGFAGADRSYKSFEQALRPLVEGCRRVTEYASGKGIKTMIENHGFFCQDSERVEKLVTQVGKESFGVLIDIGNFLCVDESPAIAVGRLASFAKHVHVKDFHIKSGNESNPGEGFFVTRGGNYLRGAIVGHGNVPVKQCLSILKKSGYDGFVSIEFEGMEAPCLGIEIGLKNLQRLIIEI